MALAKYSAEVVRLAFDLKNQDELALLGETLSSISSITFTPADGLLILNSGGPAAISGTQVLVWVSGGASKQSYTGVCLVVTSAGKTLEARAPLIILD